MTARIAQLHPKTVLWIDAGQIGRLPGHWVLRDADALATGGLSCHAGSLSLVAEYLAARTGARSYCLLAQPMRITAAMQEGPRRSELSEPMARAVREVSERIETLIGLFTLYRGADASCLPEATL